jgi:hypothetical protein
MIKHHLPRRLRNKIPVVEVCIEARMVTAPVRRLKWSDKLGRYRKYKMNDRTKRWNLVKEGES